MKKPEGVSCRDCRSWYWYAGLCNVHQDSEDLGIDHMCPESIEDCDRFEIKIHSEEEIDGVIHYDPFPSLETVELVRKIRNQEYDDLVKRIKEFS